MRGFAGEISEMIKDRSFESVALQSLIEIFGEQNAQILIFHIGGEVALKDPELFEKKVRAIFKEGADLILNHIKYNAARNLQQSKKEKGWIDYGQR